MTNYIVKYVVLICLSIGLGGCWLAAAGAGAEVGYVAAQEDRTAGETIDDQRITASVKTKLLADPEVSGLDINVDTFKGTVTLKGAVDHQGEADEAMQLAQSVNGVQKVQSKLVVIR